jgi:hypothetical protein
MQGEVERHARMHGPGSMQKDKLRGRTGDETGWTERTRRSIRRHGGRLEDGMWRGPCNLMRGREERKAGGEHS